MALNSNSTSNNNNSNNNNNNNNNSTSINNNTNASNNNNNNADSDTVKQGNLVVRIDQDYDDNLQALFDSVLKPDNSMRPLQLPFRMRKLPNSFFNPPSTGSKSPSVSHSRANSTDSAFSTGSQNGGGAPSTQAPIVPQTLAGRPGLQISHSRAHSSPASLQQTFAGLNAQNNNNSATTATSSSTTSSSSPSSAAAVAAAASTNNKLNGGGGGTAGTTNGQSTNTIQPIHMKQRSYDVVSAIQLQSELGDLPPGWEQARTPEGQIYYLNHITKTTQWEDPRTQLIQQQQQALAQVQQALTQAAATSAAVAAAKETATNDALGVLPEGWEQAVTSSGETYFINHINRTTSWFDPRISDFLVQRTQSTRPEMNSPASKWDSLRILEKEREYLKQRQQEIQHQDLLSRQNQQTMGLQMDPFLSGITDHTRQESGDSGLSFSVTPDFLPNIDDSMDCLSESGNLDSLSGLDSADNLISSLQLGNNLCSEMLNDVQNLINPTSTKADNSVWYKIQD